MPTLRSIVAGCEQSILDTNPGRPPVATGCGQAPLATNPGRPPVAVRCHGLPRSRPSAQACNEGVALVHGQGARVACPRRHTAGKGHFSQHRPYIFRPSFTPSVFAREAHFPEHGHRSGRHILFLGEARAQEDNSDNSHLLSTHQVAQGNCRVHPCIAGRSQGLTPQILALNSQTDGWRRPQGRLQGGNSLYYAQLSCPNCKYKLRVASC